MNKLFDQYLDERKDNAEGTPAILCVCGSRGIGNLEKVSNILNTVTEELGIELLNPGYVLTGGARGIDSHADKWAEDYRYERLIMTPDWDYYGKSAGYRRNEDKIEQMYLDSEANTIPHYLVAIYDGESSGTEHMINTYESRFKRRSFIFVSQQTHRDNPTHEYASRWDTRFNV